jgi:hypothetical protein
VRAVIGDQLRMPIVWCEMASCISWHADPASLGEADIRARAIAAGWRVDALGLLACPQCQQTAAAFRSPSPVALWDRYKAMTRAAQIAAAPGRVASAPSRGEMAAAPGRVASAASRGEMAAAPGRVASAASRSDVAAPDSGAVGGTIADNGRSFHPPSGGGRPASSWLPASGRLPASGDLPASGERPARAERPPRAERPAGRPGPGRHRRRSAARSVPAS